MMKTSTSAATTMRPIEPLPADTVPGIAWHAQQQPLVRAVAAPLVDEVTAALHMVQTDGYERDLLAAGLGHRAG